MPEISRFLGIIIRMFFDDHNPPHFHAYYGDQSAKFDIQRMSVIDGHLPPRVIGLVIEWAALHQKDLLDDWRKAQASEPLHKIAPLE